MIFKLRNQQNQQAIPVPPGEHSVGREDFNYIHVNEPSVSRRHARLINSNEGIFVEDLGSANGTAVRGGYITVLTRVDYGDLIYFGQVPFAVESEVPGEKHNLPTPGLKNANPERSRFRHDTEKLPVGHIQFEDSAPTPPEEDIDAEKLDVEVHDPVVHPVQPLGSPASTPNPAIAATSPKTPQPALVAASRPPAESIPAAALRPGSVPVPAGPSTHPRPTPPASKTNPPPKPTPTTAPPHVVNINTAIGLAFVAGFSLGGMAGLLLALAMN